MQTKWNAILLVGMLTLAALAWPAETAWTQVKAQPATNPATASQPASVPATSPANSSQPAEKDGLSVTVTLSKPAFAVDQPLEFTVKLKNVSKDAFQISDAGNFWNWAIKFHDTQSGATWELTKTFAQKSDLGNKAKTLKPDEAIEVPVKLDPSDGLFQFTRKGKESEPDVSEASLKPGKYKLAVEIEFLPSDAQKQTGVRCWEGKINANPVELRVVPAIE